MRAEIQPASETDIKSQFIPNALLTSETHPRHTLGNLLYVEWSWEDGQGVGERQDGRGASE